MFKNIYFDSYNDVCHLWDTVAGYKKFPYKARSFEVCKNDDPDKSKYVTVFGESVKEVRKSSNLEYEDNKNNKKCCESDLPIKIRILSEVYDNVEEIHYKFSDFNVCYFDIECAVERKFCSPEEVPVAVNLITTYCSKQNEFVTFGLEKPFVYHEYVDENTPCEGEEDVLMRTEDGRKYYEKKRFVTKPGKIVFDNSTHNDLKYEHRYVQCKNEIDLLTKFVDYCAGNEIDIYTGWNCLTFDFPYLYNRCEKLGLDIFRRLSPVGKIKCFEKFYRKENKKKLNVMIHGVSILDLMDVYKSYHPKEKRSYKLGDVCTDENIGKTKMDLGSAGLQSYKEGVNGWHKFVCYNVVDVELLVILEHAKHYLDMSIGVCADARIPLEDYFTPMRIEQGFILNFIHRKKNIVFPYGLGLDKEEYEGAYVAANPGFYKYVVSHDFRGLYPHIVMSANISIETLLTEDTVGDCINYGKSVIKGVYYNNEREGIISEIMRELVEGRDRFKALKKLHSNPENKEQYDTEKADYYDRKQLAYKKYANSMYGVLGENHFQLYDVRNAASITGIGHYLIMSCIAHAVKWFDNCLPTNEVFKKEFGEYANVTIKGRLDDSYINSLDRKQVEKLGIYKRLVLTHTDSFYFDYSDIYAPFDGRKRTREEFDALVARYCDKQSPEYDKAVASILEDREVHHDWDTMSFTEFTLRFEAKLFSRVKSLIIDKWCRDNNYRCNELYLKLEKCCDYLIELAPANYICYMEYDEGDDLLYSDFETRFHATGIPLIKTETPQWTRSIIMPVIKMIFEGATQNDIIDYVNNCYEDFKKEDNIPNISKICKVANFDLTSAGVLLPARRGAMIYNHIILNRKDLSDYEEIQEGTRCKVLYVKTPNAFGVDRLPSLYSKNDKKTPCNGTETIAFNSEKYPEFLKEYFEIDYPRQFESVFKNQLSTITQIVYGCDIFKSNVNLLDSFCD